MNAAERLATAYDEVLYPAAVHVHTAPDRLAAVGILRGMEPARFELKRGPLATSQLHKFVRLEDPISRRLVQLLDGTRDYKSILHALLSSINSDPVELYENGALLTDPDLISGAVEKRLPEVMRALVREGLLVG